MKTGLKRIKRLASVFSRVSDLAQRTAELEHKTKFLTYENLRLNQVIRELIYANSLKRVMTGSQTRGSFDFQWKTIPEGEAMPSNPEFLRQTTDMILERTRLSRDWFKGKKVLDAGCGSGRWTYGLLELGAHVTAIDQSEGGLEQTRKLNAGKQNLELLKKDLLALDLPERSFDLVWCFGVCHHTADLLLAMHNVAARVKPGGWLFMMLYGYPVSTSAFAVHASYEEWRQKLIHLSFQDKVEELRRVFKPEEVHGWFDAVSPLINDLITWEWIQAFVQERGFAELQRTIDHPNHHFVARLKQTNGRDP